MKKLFKTYSEITENEKKAIVVALDLFISELSEKFAVCAETVATVAFYRLQRHPAWGRNATKTQKDASYKYWKGICQHEGCKDKEPIERGETKFHHRFRGISDQHSPQNLVPQHTDCHDDEHNVVYGSLSKGSPKPKRLKSISK